MKPSLSLSLLFLALTNSINVALGLGGGRVNVYLNPTPFHASAPAPGQEEQELEGSTTKLLTSREARVVLAEYVGLEKFEKLGDVDYAGLLGGFGNGAGGQEVLGGGSGGFVGMGGMGKVLVVGLEGDDDTVEAIIPSYFTRPTFSSVDESLDVSSLLEGYASQGVDVYEHVITPSPLPSGKSSRLLDIFHLPSTEPSSAFLQEAQSLIDFIEKTSNTEDNLGVFDIKSLGKMGLEYGVDSQEYDLAVRTFRLALMSALEEDSHSRLVILTSTLPSVTTHDKRQPPQSPLPPNTPDVPLPHQPIGAISTCHTSVEVCANVTSGCSGHGTCVEASKAGRKCFVCTCGVSKNGKKTERWAGDACERKDVSGPFVLLAGTAIGLILLVGGSVGLLSMVGGQELPSTLTGGAAGGLKRE